MRKARILLILGVFMAVLPLLGFPYSWKNALTTLSGLGLVLFSYLLYREFKIKEIEEKPFDNFSENGDSSEKDVENKIEKEIKELKEETKLRVEKI